MLYVDLPTRNEILQLSRRRADACISIYLSTSPHSQASDASRTELSQLYKSGRQQLEEAGLDKRRLADLDELIDDFLQEDDFWRLLANSLAVLATPDRLQTFRLANRLSSMVQVSDRFHLTPLLRAVSFANAALVLAISENAVRLIEIHPDLPPSDVKAPGLPHDAASAVSKSTLNDRGHSGRIHGSEGQNVRLRQYARKIDAALRPILAGRDTPLILAAQDRMASIYGSVNSYPHLAAEHISATTDRTSDAELADAARAILDRLNQEQVGEFVALFHQRVSASRATTDISEAARAALQGAIDVLLVDIDANLPGTIDAAKGTVSFADAPSAGTYDIADEIAAQALATGASVVGVRKEDLPGDSPLAAILRFAV